MFIAIIFTVLPTLFFYLLLNRFIKSTYLKLSFSWFCGQYVLTILTFLLTTVFSLTIPNSVLQKALIVSLIFLLLILPVVHKQILLIVKKVKFNNSNFIRLFSLLLILLFSIGFYKPHLELNNGFIYTSPAYWDFQWNAPLIQNFVYGDNFPPQNESFAGMPSTYHFFWGFLVSMYSSMGLDLVLGLNYVSILGLFFLLVALVGFGEELFKSLSVGILSVFLTITSSSLHFINYFGGALNQNLLQVIKNIFTNTKHPYFFSFVSGNPYGYNGTMFNVFYFLAERQMVIGVIFLIFFTWLVYKREKIPNLVLALIGALAGAYFLWHLFIVITIFCSLLFLLIFDKDKRRILILSLPFSLVFFLHILYFKNITNSIWFYPDIGNFPKINFNFPTIGAAYPLSLINAVGYYVYAYGLKLVLLVLGLFFLYKTNRKLLVTLLSIIVPTFVMVNTIQLSPLSIYDNHKWLRPMNVVIDFLAAFAIYRGITYRKKLVYIFIGAATFVLITISGFLELIPFFNSKPWQPYAYYPSPLILQIRQKTNPQAVFLALRIREIQLAGRKVFLGNYIVQEFGLRKDLRIKIINEIYSSDSLESLCSLVRKYKIDYVETKYFNNKAVIKHTTKFHIDQKDNPISFVDVAKSCKVN